MAYIKIEQSKVKYMDIKIPDSLDRTIEQAIKGSEKTRKRYFVKCASSIAAILLIFVLGVNVSPVFAAYARKLPGISQLVEIVKFDKGLEKAVDEGFVQNIGKTVEDKGIKFTIDNVIVDKSRLVMTYTIETTEDYDDLYIGEMKLSDSNDIGLETGYDIDMAPNSNFKEKKKKSATINVVGPEKGFPENIIIKCLSFKSQKENSSKEIKGDWTINLKLDKKLMDVKPKEFVINKAGIADNVEFLIEKMKVYPTNVEVKISMDKESKVIYLNFINPRLEDEKGNQYPIAPIATPIFSPKECILKFQSNYFNKYEKLFFKADGVYFVPKDNDELIIDLENKKVLRDGGFNIQLAGEKENVTVRDKKYDLQLNYVIKDEEVKREAATRGLMGGVWFDSNLYDENNNVYKYHRGDMHSTSECKDIEGAFNIINMDKKPKILIVKIIGASKGIYKPINVRIK